MGMPPPPVTISPPPNGGEPAPAGTTSLPLAPAMNLPGVKYSPNRSSVLLYLPVVSSAKDFRVFASDPGVTVTVDGQNHEHLAGATITCSGLRQRNQCDNTEDLPVAYNNNLLDMAVCPIAGEPDRTPNVPVEMMQTVEVNGIGPDTNLVVEAIDRQCPFPGLFGTTHQDIKITAPDFPGTTEDVTVNGNPYTLQRWQPTFPVRTEAEIRAQYGSMIFNGEGWDKPILDPSNSAFPQSPLLHLAQPASVDVDPVVLARAVVKVGPSGDTTPYPGFASTDFFDDFDDDTDQPTFLRDTDPGATIAGVKAKVYTNKKWVFYDVGNEFAQFLVDRGQMNMVMGDPAQDSMSLQAMYPNVPVQLPSSTGQYLHVTYEVQRNETSRRYENLALCGSDTPGDTYVNGAPKVAADPRPGFMNAVMTTRTQPLGWNCLYLVGRGVGYLVIPGGDVMSHSDAGVLVTVVRTNPAVSNFMEYQNGTLDQYTTNFGPMQDTSYPNRWERQIDDSKMISGVWLDDQLNIWQRTKFDVFIRRDRVVVYVNGENRLCANLTSSPLTMAEGALGFWHILYHTSAEFEEIRQHGGSAVPQTGQHHVMHNTPFADERTWDNVGFQENVGLPAGFDEGRCL
jgi:hypothetical protein